MFNRRQDTFTLDSVSTRKVNSEMPRTKYKLTQIRREATPSRAVVAEELAQLYVKPLSRVSLDRSKSGTVEPKADSLLSFKCYSELIGREKVLLQLDAEFRDSNVVALIGPGGIG